MYRAYAGTEQAMSKKPWEGQWGGSTEGRVMGDAGGLLISSSDCRDMGELMADTRQDMGGNGFAHLTDEQMVNQEDSATNLRFRDRL